MDYLNSNYNNIFLKEGCNIFEQKTYLVSFLYDTDNRIVFQNTWRNQYMAGEKYAARRVYWADMVHQCNQIGMIKIDWLRQHDISSKSFYYWQKTKG